MRRSTIALAFLSCMVAGCSGARGLLPPASGVSGAGAPASALATHRSSSKTTLLIQLPPIQPEADTIPWAESPNRLSSATYKISGTLGKHAFGPLALTSGESGCKDSEHGLLCTISLDATAGEKQTLTFSTYAKETTTHDALATSSTRVDITADQQTTIAPVVYGIAHRLELLPRHATLTHGTYATDQLIAIGIDAANRQIPNFSVVAPDGSHKIAIEATLTGFVDEALSSSQDSALRCCGFVATFPYDGFGTGDETIVTSASGFASEKTTVKITGGSTLSAGLMLLSSNAQGLFPQQLLSQFGTTANGNATPSRSFAPARLASIFGEDATGAFWYGGSHYSNSGTLLGSVTLSNGETPIARDSTGKLYALSATSTQCSIDEYKAGTYGKLAPLHQIDYQGCLYGGSHLAIDGSGDMFVSMNGNDAPGQIFEYAPSTTGAGAPTRIITAPVSGVFDSIDVDEAGNLYLLIASPTDDELWKVSPDGSPATHLLTGVALLDFAVDDAGDIYAVVHRSDGDAIEVFHAGSNKASQTIAGGATGLASSLLEPLGIIVPRKQ